MGSRFSEFELNSSYQYGFLVAITLLALVLRLYKLGEWSFWIDEMYTVGHVQAHYSSFETIIQNIIPRGNTISLSRMLTGGILNALGTSEWSARLVPMLVGVISIPMFYFPIRRLFGPAVALISVLVLALSTWHLYWSQNARYVTPLSLFCTLALFAFFFGLEENRFWCIPVFLLLLMVAVGERVIALFLVPVVVCYLVSLKVLGFEMPSGFRLKNLAPILLASLGFGIYETYRSFHAGSLVVHTFSVFFDNPDQPPQPPFQLMHSIITHISVPLICLGLAGGFYLLWEKKRVGLFLFLWAIIPSVTLFIMSPFGWTNDRYVFISLSGWAILSAVTLKELLSRVEGRKKILALGIFLLLVADPIVQNGTYYRGQKGRRPDWRGIYSYIAQRRMESDLVVATKYQLGRYYLDKGVMSTDDMDPGKTVNNGQRTWFVVDAWASMLRPTTVDWIKTNSQLVKVFSVYIDDWSTNVLVYLYDPVESSFL